jgi:3-hydroxyisobutyrate dehydrogenase-like beta-hydroxyacid dehydrogenase
MGHAFAVNLIEDGYQVMVYDRDPERSTALRASGASSAAHLNELAGCDVVLTSLPDDDALAAVALGPSGLVGILAPDGRSYFHEYGQPYVVPPHRRGACAPSPGLGNPDFARARKLFVLAAGSPSGLEKVRPLLERLGQRLFVIGEDDP